MKDRSKKRRKLPKVSPNRFDPSRTGTLRRALSTEVGKGFALLKGALLKLTVEDDSFGFKEMVHNPFGVHNTANKEVERVKSQMLDDPRTMDWEARREVLVGPVVNAWTPQARAAALAARKAKGLHALEQLEKSHITLKFAQDAIAQAKKTKTPVQGGIPRLAVVARGDLLKTPGTVDTSIATRQAKEQVMEKAGVAELKAIMAGKSYKTGRVASVPISDVVPLQAAISKASTKHHIENPPTGKEKEHELPVGVKLPDGRIALHDGTHRYAAHVLAGDTHIRMSLVEDPDAKKKPTKNEEVSNVLGESHEYASTHFEIECPAMLEAFSALQSTIDPDDVVKLENDPHVTVRYGLHDKPDLPEKVEILVAGTGPVITRIQGLSLFFLQDKNQDVLKWDIDSPALHHINRTLGLLDNTQTYGYHPHMTVAYLKAGTGEKYLGSPWMLRGHQMTFTNLVISSTGEEKETVTVNVVNYDPSQPRSHGRWVSGGGILSKAAHLAKSIPVAIYAKIKTKVKEKYAKLEARYGPRYAKAIIGAALVGLPVPLPGASLALSAPVVVLAEMHRMYSGVHKATTEQVGLVKTLAKHVSNEEEMSAAEIREAAHELIRELRAELVEGPSHTNITTNEPWRFEPDADKIKLFQRWLRRQLAQYLIGKTQEELWKRYTEEGFKKGAGRAFDDTRVEERAVSYGGQEQLGFYQGTREEFLRSSFGRPVAVEKVQLLASRSFDEIVGLSEKMVTKLSRTLTDGLVQGKNPREIARDLVQDVNIGKQQAEVIARTEIIRAHAEGQLVAFKQLGVEELGVAVEWSTAEDEKVCPLCRPMEGAVFKVDEATGMIPRHPQCRCAWIPAGVGEKTITQQRTQAKLIKAIKTSKKRGSKKDKWKSGHSITKSRPKPVVTPQR